MNNSITLDEFLDFIKWENGRLDTLLDFKTNTDSVFEHYVKFSEECGELANEILVKFNMVRPEKRKENSAELKKELADVIITACLLADTLKIDVKQALAEKVEIIKNRKYV